MVEDPRALLELALTLKPHRPNCYGALDGTHLPVELPAAEQSQDCYDFKKENQFLCKQWLI